MKPRKIVTIVNQRRFNSDACFILAHDAYQDESGCWEREHGTNRFLYKTALGNYFLVTQFGGGRNQIDELGLDDALNAYEELPVEVKNFDFAFPGIEITPA